MDMKTRVSLALIALVLLSGCASKEELQHTERRVDSTRVMYNCKTIVQKQLAIDQFNQCYMVSPKTKQNRQECEEHARAMACDRLLEDPGL
jgi:phenylalanine-4-hydroxylase